ncbi:ammonium transporter [Bdellovibrio sp. NC01]|uniref:ammonium transporter n=1 Tax=Bdellovibrio sp. NC01 TaxID=2220073 RepID=UPI00115A35D6|nr:ammonium transporter [Bdellovibrio sp. NC01]QDK37480.1 ammonia channel protein [Bdellovibrio sp. NC01]
MATFSAGDTAWLLVASGLVLLMTPGLALFYGGMVSKRNMLSTMFQSFISMALISVLWVLVGFSLAFGNSLGFVGNPLTYLGFANVGYDVNPAFATTIPFALFALFQMKFAIITPALITGAFSERIRFKAYLYFAVFFCLFIYCPIAHWTWHPEGFLRKWGVLDFAGGTVVHITAGVAALASALLLKRKSENEHNPSQIPFVLTGTGLLWFGWFGFNGGSSLAANGQAVQAFLTTNTASAAAMLTWVFLDWHYRGKPSAMGACIGSVVGLVAITPAAGYVSVISSLAIGVIAPVVSYYVVRWRTRTNIDDTLDVFPCHGVGGMVGMLLTAVFAQEGGVITGSWKLLGMHVLALGIVTVYTFVVTSAGIWLIKRFTEPEISREVADLGLDLHQHGERAY